MKNDSCKKLWFTGAVQIYVDQPPITLNKNKNNVKLEKDCIKI